MSTATARPLCPVEEDTLVSAAHVHEAIARAESLERDLTSARVRNRTLYRLLREAAAAPTVVSVLKGPDREFDEIVFLSNGVRLEHRWTEAGGWRYVQAESVPGTLAAIVDGVFTAEPPVLAPDELAGIAVVVGDDAMRPVVRAARMGARR